METVNYGKIETLSCWQIGKHALQVMVLERYSEQVGVMHKREDTRMAQTRGEKSKALVSSPLVSYKLKLGRYVLSSQRRPQRSYLLRALSKTSSNSVCWFIVSLILYSWLKVPLSFTKLNACNFKSIGSTGLEIYWRLPKCFWQQLGVACDWLMKLIVWQPCSFFFLLKKWIFRVFVIFVFGLKSHSKPTTPKTINYWTVCLSFLSTSMISC